MEETIIIKLKKSLPNTTIIIGEALRDRYTHIWRMDEPLKALAVILPKATEEVAIALKVCHANNQPVVVHGGLTNLVGSTETTNGQEVVISMEKMNAILEIDPQSRTMIVQAGVILENVQNLAMENDLLFPLNYGAKGSAQIGGAISTNAGGLRVFRYGMMRNLVLGLEAVLADGTIISSLKKIIKDNSAYDIKQLFIGSEGTLGVVTKAVLKLVEAPKSRNSAWVGLKDYPKVVQFLKFMDSGLAGTLSGFELMLKASFVGMTSPPSTIKAPLPYEFPYYVLLESLGSNQEQDLARFESLLGEALEKEIIADAAIAYTASDLEWFWKIREEVSIIIGQCENGQNYDVSLPIPEIGDYVDQTVKKLFQIPAVNRIYTLGHVADGNIHFSIGKNEQSQALINLVNDTIYEPLAGLDGSVSAEHGIGLDKKAYLSLCRTPAEIQLMKTLKHAMDPKGILNRGKVLD